MTLDVRTLALIQGLIFTTQVLFLGLQFDLSRGSHRELGRGEAGAGAARLGV